MASAPDPWQASSIPYSNLRGTPESFGVLGTGSAPIRPRAPLWHWSLALLAGLAHAASLALPGSGTPQWWLQLASLLAMTLHRPCRMHPLTNPVLNAAA